VTGFVPLFDGRTLTGWHAVPRGYGPMWPGGPTVAETLPELAADYEERAAAHPAHWDVVDGAIEGFQDPAFPGYGGYLVSDRTFGDFELTLETNPDWPADTGVMLRRRCRRRPRPRWSPRLRGCTTTTHAAARDGGGRAPGAGGAISRSRNSRRRSHVRPA
jgi:hypothetical protein